MIYSYKSPKTEVRKSPIDGRGLFARKSFRQGEIVAVKGGHLINFNTLKKYESVVRDAELQITDKLFLAPLAHAEFNKVMCFVNHSCEPNVGVKGNIIFVAMRNIKAGEELTTDYATIDNIPYRMVCGCKRMSCRRVITGKDWKLKNLQKKYKGFFSWYLEEKIKR